MAQINIILILFSVFILFDIIDTKKCGSHQYEEVDVCMQKMLLIGDRTQKFRETIDEMHIYCKNITDLQNCVKRFSRECLPRFARQITNLLLFGVTKVNKPLCVNDANKIAFTKVAKCGNINIESKHTCMDQFIDDLKDTETDEKKIPFVCCNFWKFKDCIRSTFDKVDSNRCPQESINGVLNLISGYTGDALDLICSEFDDGSDKCKNLLISSNIKKSKTSRKGKVRSRSLLPSFIHIFTNL